MGRLFWIIREGPKCNYTYPYKRAVKGDLTYIQKRRQRKDEAERDLKMLALKTGVMWAQAKECQQPPETGRGKE